MGYTTSTLMMFRDSEKSNTSIESEAVYQYTPCILLQPHWTIGKTSHTGICQGTIHVKDRLQMPRMLGEGGLFFSVQQHAAEYVTRYSAATGSQVASRPLAAMHRILHTDRHAAISSISTD